MARKKAPKRAKPYEAPRPDINRILYVDSDGLMKPQISKKALKDYIDGKTLHLILNRKNDYGKFEVRNP